MSVRDHAIPGDRERRPRCFRPAEGLLLLAALASCGAPGREPPDAAWRAPFVVPRNSFFHASLEVPPMQSAEVLPEDVSMLDMRLDFARSREREHEDGVPQGFEGLFEEWAAVTLRQGLSDRWEIGARTTLEGWNEHQDHFSLVDANGNALVTHEQVTIDETGASSRHMGVGEVTLQAKRELSDRGPWTLAGLGVLKVPVGRPRDLNNAGTWDLSAGLLATHEPCLPTDATWHLNAGVGAPLGSQDLFVHGTPAEIVPFAFASVGATWPVTDATVMGVQLEGNTSAFQHVPLMDGDPVTIFGGARTLSGGWIFEYGLGTGLNESAYDWALHLGASRVF